MKLSSIYSDKPVTEAHYLVEVLFEKIAKKEKYDLPRKFWSLPKFIKKYRYQIVLANGLLKIYPFLAILNVLRKSWTIYSLSMLDCLKINAEALKIENKSEPQSVEVKKEPLRPKFKEKSTIDALRNLDG